MGFLKQRQIDQGEAGYSMIGWGAVCSTCTGEPDLARFVEGRLVYDHCDFCNRQAEEPIAADTDEVLSHIGESLQLEFEDANTALPRDSESPTGLFGSISDTREAID